MSKTKKQIYRIIFEHDTPLGKGFDICLIILVLLSVLTIMLETVQDYYISHSKLFQSKFNFVGNLMLVIVLPILLDFLFF